MCKLSCLLHGLSRKLYEEKTKYHITIISTFHVQVVTKVQRVEIESAQSQSALKDASVQNEQLRLQLELLQEEQKQKVASHQDEAAREKAALQEHIARLNAKVLEVFLVYKLIWPKN